MGRGINAVIDDPYGAMEKGLSKLRNLLPFSDAKEGPLSSLTQSGMALLQTFGAGIEKTAKLPGQAVEGAFGFLGKLGKKLIPPTLAGALGLSPMLAGELPQPAADLALTPALTAGITTPASDLNLNPTVNGAIPPQSAALALSPPPDQPLRVKPTLAANWPAPQMTTLPALPPAAQMIQTERNGLPAIPDASQKVFPKLAGALPPADLGINALMPSLHLPELGAKVRPLLDAIPNQELGLFPKLQGALPELTTPLNYSGKLNSSISGKLDLPSIPDKVLGLIPRLRESIPDLQGQLKLPELGEQSLGLNPIMSALPDFSLPDLPILKAPETIPPVQMPEHQSQLLAETRSSLAQTVTPESPRREGDSKNDSGLLGAILEKLDGLSERPISVQLTTQLDGRQIAQSVYKDIREQKIKNYGTLH